MILQCMKCDLYFRSFNRIKYHKALQCTGEVRDNKDNLNDGVDNDANDNPWSYNLNPSEAPVKTEEPIKTEVKEEIKQEVDTEVINNNNDEKAVKDEKKEYVEDDKDEIVKKEKSELEESNSEDVDDIKDEPVDGEEDSDDKPRARRDPYKDGVYRPAAAVVDSDSEYEAESDDSAPEDDDIETHLGMLTKWNPHKEDQPRIRKRKRAIPENAKIVFMVKVKS